MPVPLLPHTKVNTLYHALLKPLLLFLCRWFLAAHIQEVLCRLPAILAAATSVYGSVLKIDSTKKVCKKLQGAAANTASWATNVGNERGEVLISVLTESEGNEGLHQMAVGLMGRYQHAGVEPPLLLYTDRDCCAKNGPSKYQVSIGTYMCTSSLYNPLADPVCQVGRSSCSPRHLALHEEVGKGVYYRVTPSIRDLHGTAFELYL